MSSNLKVNTILPSVGSNIGIGTNGGELNVDSGCKVQVGTALTLGHSIGLQYATQNLHSEGFEINQINASGIITASHFYGNGANLTGITAGTSLSGSTNNTVCTVTGANAIQGESTLTYDGNKLKFGGGTRALDNGYYDDIVIDNSDTTSGETGGSGISLISGTSSWCGLIFGDSDEHQRAYVKYSNDSEYMQIHAPSTGYIRFDTGSERLRITSDGKFGFGTSSPDQTVHIHKGSAGSVSSTANTVLTLENSTTNVLQFLNPNNTSAQIRFGDPQDDGAGFIDYNHTSNTMAFGANGPTRMQIDSSGNMSLGGISPVPTSTSYNTASFHIHQQTNNSGYGAQIHLTTANKGSAAGDGTQLSQYNGSLYINNQDDQFIYFYNNDNSGHRIAIRNDGTVCFGNQTSNTLYSSGGGSTWYDQKDSWQMAQSGDLGWSCWYMNKIGGSDNRMIQFNSSGSAIGYINRSGSNVVYQTSSDYRLKKDDV